MRLFLRFSLKLLFISIPILFLFFSEGLTRDYSDYQDINKSLSVELTVKEAYSIALKKAKEWDVQAGLESLTSVDTDSDDASDGDSGKRTTWNLLFAVPAKGKSLLISISNGIIANVIEAADEVQEQQIIHPKEVLFDSPELLTKSKEIYHLQPGLEWAKGYHFVLQKFDGQVLFTIVGLSSNKLFTKITWDPQTGELLEAIEKQPKGGGALFIQNGEEIRFSQMGGEVNGIAVSKYEDKMLYWGNAFVNSVSTPSQPYIKFSIDGESWSNILLPHYEAVVDAWFTTYDDFFVATRQHLYFSSENLNLKEVLNIASPIIDVSHDADHIAILTEDHIVSTTNLGLSWTTTPTPDEPISIVAFNEQLYILTETGNVFGKNSDTWSSIIADEANVSDIINLQNKLVARFSDSSMRAYEYSSNKWSQLFSNNNNTIRLFPDKGSENEQFYSVTSDGKLFQHLKTKQREWVRKEIYSQTAGLITDVLHKRDKLYISFTPSFEWDLIDNNEFPQTMDIFSQD